MSHICCVTCQPHIALTVSWSEVSSTTLSIDKEGNIDLMSHILAGKQLCGHTGKERGHFFIDWWEGDMKKTGYWLDLRSVSVAFLAAPSLHLHQLYGRQKGLLMLHDASRVEQNIKGFSGELLKKSQKSIQYISTAMYSKHNKTKTPHNIY